MISFVLSLIIRLLNFVIGFIINLVLSAFPDLGIARLSAGFSLFFALLTKGANLLYFLCGDMLFIFGDIIITLFAVKHIILPIVNFTRKVIIK